MLLLSDGLFLPHDTVDLQLSVSVYYLGYCVLFFFCWWWPFPPLFAVPTLFCKLNKCLPLLSWPHSSFHFFIIFHPLRLLVHQVSLVCLCSSTQTWLVFGNSLVLFIFSSPHSWLGHLLYCLMWVSVGEHGAFCVFAPRFVRRGSFNIWYSLDLIY